MARAIRKFDESPQLLYDEKRMSHRVQPGEIAAFKVLGQGGIWEGVITDVHETMVTLVSEHGVEQGKQVILSPTDCIQPDRVNHALAECVSSLHHDENSAYILGFNVLYFMS